MSRPKSIIGSVTTGAPFCWHCSRHLQWAKGKGQVYFKLVVDRDGNEHRVHADCVAMVTGDGVKEKKG